MYFSSFKGSYSPFKNALKISMSFTSVLGVFISMDVLLLLKIETFFVCLQIVLLFEIFSRIGSLI